MQFIFKLLQKVAAGMDANKAAKEAYAESLSHYHNFIVKKSFEVGLMTAPSSDTMLPCLGSDKVAAPLLHCYTRAATVRCSHATWVYS